MEKQKTKLNISYTQPNGDEVVVSKTFESLGIDIYDVRTALIGMLVGAGFCYETVLEIMPEENLEIKFEN
jgi:hypothetical protein